MEKMKALYLEISGLLDSIEQKSAIFGKEFIVMRELQNYILELKELVKKEKTDYNVSSGAAYLLVCNVTGAKVDGSFLNVCRTCSNQCLQILLNWVIPL